MSKTVNRLNSKRVIYGLVLILLALMVIIFTKGSKTKTIEIYNLNGTLLETVEGKLHLGDSPYIKLEDGTIMLTNSNFTYTEKELKK